MQNPPLQLDGANVVCFVFLNKKHRQRDAPPTATRERSDEQRNERPASDTRSFIVYYVDGKPMEPVPALAVCCYPGEEDRSAYLFYCNADWSVVQDDLFFTVDEAIDQACIQYEGLQRADWQWMD